MRINKFIAQNTSFSRREADKLIIDGRVKINQKIAQLFDQVENNQVVFLDNKIIQQNKKKLIVLFNKPTGYIVSKSGQGQKTIYDILPKKYHNLNYVGRLDKNSSGLLILTNNNPLIDQLTNPKFKKIKQYEIKLNRQLEKKDWHEIEKNGVLLDFGISKFNIKPINQDKSNLLITIYEGKNRQIRKTFEKLKYSVKKLHRIKFAQFELNDLPRGATKEVENN